jgi:hypothetical protein
MHRTVKVKALATRVPLRKAATSASAAARRPFPAWIEADDRPVPMPLKVVTPRVRAGLVLRVVAKKKAGKGSSSHVDGAR